MPAARTNNSTGSAARNLAAVAKIGADPVKRIHFKGALVPWKTHNENARLPDFARRICSLEVLGHGVLLDVTRICDDQCSFCDSNLGRDLSLTLRVQSRPLEIMRILPSELAHLARRIVDPHGERRIADHS